MIQKIIGIIFISIIGLIAALSLFAFIFLKIWKPFGGKANRADKKNYSERASNFYNGKFHNEEDFSVMAMEKSPAPDPLTFSKKSSRPDFEFPTKKPDFLDSEHAAIEELKVTWFGHSSLLVQMHGLNILIDPVFSEMISPVSFVGSRRFSHPGITVDDLPEIDILIQTHDHYDHLDYDVIKQIDKKVKLCDKKF